MSDVIDGGSAPAPAESSFAPFPTTESAPSLPKPLGSQTPVEPKPEAASTPRDAVDKAMDKVKADNAAKEAGKTPEPKKTEPKPEAKSDAKPDAKPEPKSEEQPRGERGQFASKDSAKAAQEPASGEQQPAATEAPKPRAPHDEAPSRFSEDGKREWASAPESVRAEAHRAISELTGGIEKYRAEYEPVKPWVDLAKQHGTTVHDALERYTTLERALKADPVRGLEMVAQDMGFSLREVAAHIAGQTPDQVSSQQDNTIRELNAKIARLEQGLGGIQQNFEQQRVSATQAEVEKFSGDKPRFEELEQHIIRLLQNPGVDEGLAPNLPPAQRLAKAYELADRLNPAPASASAPAAQAANPTDAPLKPAASKSIHGAQSPGSNPVNRSGPVPSPREAVDRAFASVRAS